MAHAGLRFRLSRSAELFVGYWHDFRIPWFTELVRVDAAGLRFRWMVAKVLELRADVAWARLDYLRLVLPGASGGTCDASGLCERVDDYLQVELAVNYYFLAWLSAGIGLSLQADFTDFSTTYAGFTILPGFFRPRVYARLAASY